MARVICDPRVRQICRNSGNRGLVRIVDCMSNSPSSLETAHPFVTHIHRPAAAAANCS